MAAVSPGLRMTTQAGDQGEIEVEDILQPLDSSGRLVGKNLDEIWSRLVARRLQGVIIELLDAVSDAQVDLRPRKGAVDSGCGLC